MTHTTMPAKVFYCSLFNSSAINLHIQVHIYTDCDKNTTFLAEVCTAGNLTKPGRIWLNITYTRMTYTSRNKRILSIYKSSANPLTYMYIVSPWLTKCEHGENELTMMTRGEERCSERPSAQSTPFQHSPKHKNSTNLKILKYILLIISHSVIQDSKRCYSRHFREIISTCGCSLLLSASRLQTRSQFLKRVFLKKIYIKSISYLWGFQKLDV